MPQLSLLSPAEFGQLRRTVDELQWLRHPCHLADKLMFKQSIKRKNMRELPYTGLLVRSLQRRGLAGNVVPAKGKSRFRVALFDPALPRGSSIMFGASSADPFDVWYSHLAIDLNGNRSLREHLDFPIPDMDRRGPPADKGNALPINYSRLLREPEDGELHRSLQVRQVNKWLYASADWLAAQLSSVSRASAQKLGRGVRSYTLEDVQTTLLNAELSTDWDADHLSTSIDQLLDACPLILPNFLTWTRPGWTGGVARILRCHSVGLYAHGDGAVLREDNRQRGLKLTWDFLQKHEGEAIADELWRRVRRRGGPFLPRIIAAALLADTLNPSRIDLNTLLDGKFRGEGYKLAREILYRVARAPVRTGFPGRKREDSTAPLSMSDKEKDVAEALHLKLEWLRRAGTNHLSMNYYKYGRAVLTAG